MKKKYPEIKPKFFKDAKGKTKAVYLDLDVYESILEEITELKNQYKPNITRTRSKNFQKANHKPARGE